MFAYRKHEQIPSTYSQYLHACRKMKVHHLDITGHTLMASTVDKMTTKYPLNDFRLDAAVPWHVLLYSQLSGTGKEKRIAPNKKNKNEKSTMNERSERM